MPHEVCRERRTAPQNITVVLPAYNKEMSIGSVVLLARLYADRVIVVDDGSSDRTAEIAKNAGAEVVVPSPDRGKGMAFKIGFLAAEGADIIVTMDSDGQHDPADIPKLVAPILEGVADMVNGSRYLTYSGKKAPLYSLFGQIMPGTTAKINFDLKITDSMSGFCAFAASTKDIFRFNAAGMAIKSEMLADAGRAGLRVKEVPIRVRHDVDGSTENPVRRSLADLFRIFKYIEYNKPLYCFTLPGSLLGAGGLYMGSGFLRTFYLGGSLNFGPAVLMILLTLTGAFMAFTGIMLHSIAGLIPHLK